MPDRSERKYVYLTPREAAELSRTAERAAKSEAQVLRQALREYLDHDRAARIEERVARIEEKLDLEGAEETATTHTHTSTGDRVTQASPTVEKARAVARRLRENNDGSLVWIRDVERAIKDIAGADDRTVQKYRRELRERGHVYEHPHAENDRAYLDREDWLGVVESYCEQAGDPVGTLRTVLEEYPLTVDDVLGSEVLADV